MGNKLKERKECIIGIPMLCTYYTLPTHGTVPIQNVFPILYQTFNYLFIIFILCSHTTCRWGSAVLMLIIHSLRLSMLSPLQGKDINAISMLWRVLARISMLYPCYDESRQGYQCCVYAMTSLPYCVYGSLAFPKEANAVCMLSHMARPSSQSIPHERNRYLLRYDQHRNFHE